MKNFFATKASRIWAVILLGAVCQPSSPAGMVDGRLDSGEWTVGGRFSDQVQELFTDILVPLHETDSSILHLNLRGTFLEGIEQESNAGLVLRHIPDDQDILLGVNLFYDSRWTEHDHYFDQFGAGLEVLTEAVDIRANYYYPLGDTAKTIGERSETSVSRRSTSARRITTTTRTFLKTYEEAMDGFDVELGGLVPGLPDRFPVRLFAGYYRFYSEFENDPKGWKFRLESHLSDMIIFDAEWIEDKALNGTDFFAGFRIHVPLDFWNGIGNRERPEGLKGRLRDMVNRDFRIRTIDSGELVVAATTEEEIKRIPLPPPPQIDPPPEPEPCEQCQND